MSMKHSKLPFFPNSIRESNTKIFLFYLLFIQSNKMKFISLLLLFSTISISCQNPVNIDGKSSSADAGKDQTTDVGSYAVLDISKSTVTEPIRIIDWVQGASNPKEVNLFSQSSLKDKWILAFESEGVYKFILNINCENGDIYSDSITITVKPRQESVVDDIYLEARIRFRLDYKNGALNTDKLRMIDSLPTPGFHIKNYKTKSLEGLEYCKNLKLLNLALESITDLNPLAELTDLESLDLNQNRTVEDISPISNLINLKTLILYSNPIKDISVLSNLTKLTELWLLDTPISDINPLRNLSNLEVLYIDGVGLDEEFSDISALSYLTKLKYLDIAGRGLTDIKPLENLTELVLLNVSYNNLTEISAVSNMKKLIRLLIRKNKVEDISGAKNLETLDLFDAVDNNIKDISELLYLPNIHWIGLTGNEIEDISPLVNNPFLGPGVSVYLGGNSLNEKSINEYIPALIKRGVTIYTNL